MDILNKAYLIMGIMSAALCVLGIVAMIRGFARGEISFSSDEDRRPVKAESRSALLRQPPPPADPAP